MKIGIITIHSAYNYGAVFQAFALKEYLKTLLSERDVVNVIDYRPAHFDERKKIHFSTDIRSNLIELERLMMHFKLQRRDKSFESFISGHDSLSETCRDRQALSELAKDYDLIISGSDQIWNLNLTSGDTAYLLDIEGYSKKKMAYASSFGSFRFNEDDENGVRNLFEKFSVISCRESDGCDYINELTGKNCVQVCDPTLLLDKETYSELYKDKVREKIKKLAEEKFLLIYNLSSSDVIFSVAERVSKERKLNVYQIFPSLRKNAAVDKLLNDISPEEFLYLYSKADFIVTNSFHGTCFSIINRKNFYTVSPTGSSNRLESLLSSIGLSDRLVMGAENTDRISCGSNIDYNSVENMISEYKEKSKSLLKENLFV